MKLTSREVEVIQRLRQTPKGRMMIVTDKGYIRQIVRLDPGDRVPVRLERCEGILIGLDIKTRNALNS